MAIHQQRRFYTPYGYAPDDAGYIFSGFNGQYLDLCVMGYPLGQGKRIYAPARGRFNTSDPLSPFGGGGINCYAYCEGDPVNFTDPSGLVRSRVSSLGSAPSTRRRQPPPYSAHSNNKRVASPIDRKVLPPRYTESDYTERPPAGDPPPLYSPAHGRRMINYLRNLGKKPSAESFARHVKLVETARPDSAESIDAARRGLASDIYIPQQSRLSAFKWRAITVGGAIFGLGLVALPIILSEIRKND
ncbi:RHS repeat-associated core domain-containing protein [Pseudomonas monteilii]|nr:RHS repeat-associated core domain-containing protein [Pseudomonas monteilii]